MVAMALLVRAGLPVSPPRRGPRLLGRCVRPARRRRWAAQAAPPQRPPVAAAAAAWGPLGGSAASPGARQAGADVAARRCPLPTPPARPLPPARHGSKRQPVAGLFVSSLSVRAGGRDPRRGGEPRGSRPARSPGCRGGRTCPRGLRVGTGPPPPPRCRQRLRFVVSVCPQIPTRVGERTRRKALSVPRLLLNRIFEATVRQGKQFLLGQAPSAAVRGMCVVPDLLFQPGLGVWQLLTAENNTKEPSGSGSVAFLLGALQPSHKNGL